MLAVKWLAQNMRRCRWAKNPSDLRWSDVGIAARASSCYAAPKSDKQKLSLHFCKLLESSSETRHRTESTS